MLSKPWSAWSFACWPALIYGASLDGRRLEAAWCRQVAEAGELGLKQQLHWANRAVSVLGDDYFGDASIGGVGVVVLIALDHQHQIGILFD
jgi:hypothetical protein